MSTLQNRLNEFKKTIESGAGHYSMPREAVDKMHRATAELKASGIEDRALKVGDRAPDFALFNQDHAGWRRPLLCGVCDFAERNCWK